MTAELGTTWPEPNANGVPGMAVPSVRTCEALVMIADLIIIGVQSGWAWTSRAAMPAMCGELIDVPDRKSKLRPASTGETAASTSTPGAMTSGLSRSPEPVRAGPREENEATSGATAPVTCEPGDRDAVAPAVAAYARRARRSVLWTWTVGTACRSALSELNEVLTSTMPTPPAAATTSLFWVRALTPRSQTTILPATAARASEPGRHSRAASATAPGAAAAVEVTSGELGTAAPRPAPDSTVPLPRVTVAAY